MKINWKWQKDFLHFLKTGEGNQLFFQYIERHGATKLLWEARSRINDGK